MEISLTHSSNDIIFRMNWPKVSPIFGISSVMLTGNDHKQMMFWKQFHAGIVSSTKQTQEQTHLISRIPPTPGLSVCASRTLMKLRHEPGPLRAFPHKSHVETVVSKQQLDWVSGREACSGCGTTRSCAQMVSAGSCSGMVYTRHCRSKRQHAKWFRGVWPRKLGF